MGLLIPMLVVFVGMYFMMIRPQKKQQKERQNLLNAMKQGDKVVTIGGLHGMIHEINTDANTITIDCEGIYLEFDRNAIKIVNPVGDVNTEVETELPESTTEAVEVEETASEDKEENQ